MPPTVTFAGGAGTVTGSKHLIDLDGRRVLLDCGLFQGLKNLRERNWRQLPFDARTLDAVVLSHGHVDHSGHLPALARAGFSGVVHCTSGTASLLGVVLRDAARLQEEDARRANRYGYTRHHPAEPLFTMEDVEAVLKLLAPHRYGERFPVMDELYATFRRSGHILGSATVTLEIGRSRPNKVVFSGDLGRWGRPILRDPELLPEADVLLLESTYGDRVHRPDPDSELVRIATETFARGGLVMVPAFAIGRTQELLWRLSDLMREGRMPRVPVFVDSPMATAVTDIYMEHPEDHDLDMKRLMEEGRCPLVARDYHIVRTPDESRGLNDLPGAAIIIAGSGMATGGRILHHLQRRLSDPRHTVLLPGFQAAGTRGRALQDGAETLRIFGQDVPVKARVESMTGLSAHADKDELLRWLRGFHRPPAKTWLVHGEPQSLAALAVTIREELGWTVDVAEDQATVPLF